MERDPLVAEHQSPLAEGRDHFDGAAESLYARPQGGERRPVEVADLES